MSSTSQGSIIANNGTVTATVGQLYPASNTVTITLVASTSILATDGQILSNRAFVNSQPIITQTNVVTHQIINRPILALTKQAGEIWQKRVKLVFTNTTVAENLTDFPVLVTLNSGRIDYALTQNAGQDIRFVDPDGKLLSHEIENWDENGTSSVWVKIPQIDALSNADYVWLYYDNPFASDGQNPADVWSSN